MGKLTKLEKETIINYNDSDGIANIYSCNKNMMKKLLDLENEYPDKVKVTYKSDVSLNVEIPKEWIKISAPRKLTDEQRKAARERMLKNRKK
ncbi:hypothetical protein [Thomasclavelia cocleata]|uniref:hypothetical protein n=1 Tax=Thomasclavelia cocleata TaxID=69824 RepID=UPI00256F5A80|nr:hypothetical protein [Thomasclavelia cocleata]